MSRWTLIGVVSGCMLFIFGFGALGMGHGTFLPMAIYGAPLSVVRFAGVLVTPLWWTVLGWTVSSRRKTVALALLVANLIGAALFVIFGTPMEHGEDQWKYFDRAEEILPGWVWGGFISYSATMLLFLKGALSISRKSTA